ncbi:MAG TPA: twin-arginine translocase subunit TatC [Bryobacteraceae bacterium]|nr:twin-arginine translocase subunit TatC [Bryobacteraceae bacterium]
MDETNASAGGEVPPAEVTGDQTSGFPDDPFGPSPPVVSPPPTALEKAFGNGGGRVPPPPSEDDEDDDEEEGMLRMSFLEHLEELRARILKALYGFGIIFLACIVFSNQLFKVVLAPGLRALAATGNPNARFIAIDPMEQFSIIWVWTPLVASLFLGSPWILYQVWAFISPGLYRREKKWAVPFVLFTAGLFVLGGVFGYFVAFPYGMSFLFGIGGMGGNAVTPMITIDNYFDKFVDVMLGIGVVFELPVLIFFLSLLRIVSPSFLLAHSRYAILAIVIIAAIITPTPDVFNLMLFAVPMSLLFFLGIFASYLLVLRRENRRFPWLAFLRWLAVVAGVIALAMVVAVVEYNYHFTWHWPFLHK